MGELIPFPGMPMTPELLKEKVDWKDLRCCVVIGIENNESGNAAIWCSKMNNGDMAYIIRSLTSYDTHCNHSDWAKD